MVEFLYWKEIFQCFDIGKGKEYRESIVLGILSYLKGLEDTVVIHYFPWTRIELINIYLSKGKATDGNV